MLFDFSCFWPLFYLCLISFQFHNSYHLDNSHDMVVLISFHSQPSLTWASIHSADRYFTTRSGEVSEQRHLGLDFSNHSEIWQAPGQQCYQDTFQSSELYNLYNIQSHGLKTSRDLSVRLGTIVWLEAGWLFPVRSSIVSFHYLLLAFVLANDMLTLQTGSLMFYSIIFTEISSHSTGATLQEATTSGWWDWNGPFKLIVPLY